MQKPGLRHSQSRFKAIGLWPCNNSTKRCGKKGEIHVKRGEIHFEKLWDFTEKRGEFHLKKGWDSFIKRGEKNGWNSCKKRREFRFESYPNDASTSKHCINTQTMHQHLTIALTPEHCMNAAIPTKDSLRLHVYCYFGR